MEDSKPTDSPAGIADGEKHREWTVSLKGTLRIDGATYYIDQRNGTSVRVYFACPPPTYLIGKRVKALADWREAEVFEIAERKNISWDEFKQLSGIDITGGVDSVEYIRAIREGRDPSEPSRDELIARLKRAEAERDAWKTQCVDAADSLNSAANAMLEKNGKIKKLESERDRLKEALEPFRIMHEIYKAYSDALRYSEPLNEMSVVGNLRYGGNELAQILWSHLEIAAAALADAGKGGGE